MRIPGARWLRQKGRWLRSRWTGGTLILGYHRVSATDDDPYDMCVQEDHFGDHLAILRELANPIRLDQLYGDQTSGRLPPQSVVITFDDGYFDNLQNARPLLAQYGVPATLFVATGYLGRLFWWDELAQLVLDAISPAQELVLRIAGKTHRRRFSGENDLGDDEQSSGRSELLHELYRSLLPLDAKHREEILDQVREWSSLDNLTIANSAMRAMSADEVWQMAEGDLVTIGAHTVTHPLLPSLSTAEQRREIVESKQCLEEIFDRPVKTFSYPNGSGSDITGTLLRQAGIEVACTSFNDVARPGSDPLFLPRFWVPDWDGETFARWLRRWLPAASRHYWQIS